MIRSLRAWFASRTGRLVVHDAALAAAAAAAVLEGAHNIDAGVLKAAGLVGLKVLLRLVLPVPAGQSAAEPDPPRAPKFSVRYDVHNRVRMLPKPSGRKGGALPSPRDDRDYQAKLPTKIPASVDNGAGITWGMLLNDRIGDCYPAALLHALQVLAPTGFFPSNADALAVYEQVTGYDPARTDAQGNNPTDRGTYGRQLFDWARRQGLIASYAAVPPTTAAVKAAIAGHKAVLCEWALPAGAETEGDVWTMPRSGRTPGSWGGHATVEVGYTPTRNRNVTWGEQGTVTAAFENAYLQAAWVIEVPAGANIAAIMAKVRTA